MTNRILIVDDDDLSRDVLKALLDTHTDIDTAIDETDSGELAIKMSSECHYDIVFMNMRLPDLRSSEVVNEIRDYESLQQIKQPAKIIAVCDRYPGSKPYDWSREGFDESIDRPLYDQDIVRAITL